MNSLQILIVAVGLVSMSPAFSQNSEREKIEELEKLNLARRQSDAQQALDSAIQDISRGQYEQADKTLTRLLKSVKTVPSDLAYWFGENSFHLGKNRQSIDWLTKYIQLKGTSGSYSSDAVTYLKKAEDALMGQVKQQHQDAAEILARDFDIDCGPTGKVVCPVCSGRTVIIKKDYLSEKFSTCPYCDKHGYLTCEKYNQLLRGQLTKN